MRFVTGGAFNGKKAWVKERYPDSTWFSAYRGDFLPEKEPENFINEVIILEGLEVWVREMLMQKGLKDSRNYFRDVWEGLLSWEQFKPGRHVIVIGTDITKGVVPIDKEQRAWRDITGWVYQDLAKKCERIDIIWYGISRTIKGEA